MARSQERGEGFSAFAVMVAFVSGVLVGTGATLLVAPEAGAQIRRRLGRGVRTVQGEFADIAAETTEALSALSKDARQTLRHTATRLSAALDATREALTTDSPIPKGTNRHG
jgi:gas vesicle protein